jgi:hypothetical protein
MQHWVNYIKKVNFVDNGRIATVSDERGGVGSPGAACRCRKLGHRL